MPKMNPVTFLIRNEFIINCSEKCKQVSNVAPIFALMHRSWGKVVLDSLSLRLNPIFVEPSLIRVWS